MSEFVCRSGPIIIRGANLTRFWTSQKHPRIAAIWSYFWNKSANKSKRKSFCSFINEVSNYVSLDWEVRRQLVSDFVEKTHPTIGSYLNKWTRIVFLSFTIFQRKTLAQGGNFEKKSAIFLKINQIYREFSLFWAQFLFCELCCQSSANFCRACCRFDHSMNVWQQVNFDDSLVILIFIAPVFCTKVT